MRPPEIDAAILWFFEECQEFDDGNNDIEELMDIIGTVGIVHYLNPHYAKLLSAHIPRQTSPMQVAEAAALHKQWASIQFVRQRWALPLPNLLQAFTLVLEQVLNNQQLQNHGRKTSNSNRPKPCYRNRRPISWGQEPQ